MSTTSIPCPSVEDLFSELDANGFALVPDVEDQAVGQNLLRSIGELIPQYRGGVTHEVTHRPGNDDYAYSQSANTILAHTEAPGWNPSPAYLALYCHRQARCGGGHTDLLDVEDLSGHLAAEELTLLTSSELYFPGPGGGVRAPLLSHRDNGRPVLRFSYNLLTSGEYDPPLGYAPDPDGLPLGGAGWRLAHRVSKLFGNLRRSILIPDGALLLWDNQRMLHARSEFVDHGRHLTRFWVTDRRIA